jgi:fatty acid desaturase
LTFYHAQLPIWLAAPLGSWLIAWHSSLQHELLHAHPTRWQWVNHTVGRLPLSLWLPFDIYRISHLAHHREENLTDPLQDPESYYWSPTAWAELGPIGRVLVRFQTTLLGRLTLGPAWTVWRLVAQGLSSQHVSTRDMLTIWGIHLLGCGMILIWIVGMCNMNFWVYLFGIVYPGTSLSLLRSFAEHRAGDTASERTVIVENARIFGLLFLFNNLHVVHHHHPNLPWYRIPNWYRQHREMLIAENGGIVYDGYFEILRRFLFSPHDNPVHPIMS